MDIQKEQDAFERFKAKQTGMDYETLKKDLDDCEKRFPNNRYAGWNFKSDWEVWQAATAQGVPEGFVLVEKSKIRTWYQDDDEPKNFCNSESDLNCLGDCLDDDDIIAVNIHESAHISTRKVFGVWKSNSPTDIQSNFVLVDSREKAEEIVASNKAMIEAQEPAND